jgi:saccharopine dehydrogenase-like NADP-dependent oxidoreductase
LVQWFGRKADLTVMQIVVEGTQDGIEVRELFHLLDRYDEKSRTHSMARTTGYTATVAVRTLAQGLCRVPFAASAGAVVAARPQRL